MTPSLQCTIKPKWLLLSSPSTSSPVIPRCCCPQCNVHHQLHHASLFKKLSSEKKIYQDPLLWEHIRMNCRLYWCSFLPFFLSGFVYFCHLPALFTLVFLVKCPHQIIWAQVIKFGLLNIQLWCSSSFDRFFLMTMKSRSSLSQFFLLLLKALVFSDDVVDPYFFIIFPANCRFPFNCLTSALRATISDLSGDFDLHI